MLKCFASFLVLACNGIDADSAGFVVTNRSLLVHDPRLGPVNRMFRLTVPTGIPRGVRMPLVLGFHGQGHAPEDWAQSHIFDKLAGQHEWVVAYPAGIADGPDSGWNCGTASDNSTCVPNTTETSCHDSCKKLGQCGRCSWSACYDDVFFVDKIIETLEAELSLNEQAYFLVGESNGGMLMHHIIQERPGKFLGAAPIYALPLMGYLVGSKFQLITQAARARRTSLFSMFPRQDTTIPWEGGPDDDGWLYETRDKVFGVWASLHECKLEVEPMPAPSADLTCFLYPLCSSGHVQYCMYDGKHGDWPAQPFADNMIWSFLMALLQPKETATFFF